MLYFPSRKPVTACRAGESGSLRRSVVAALGVDAKRARQLPGPLQLDLDFVPLSIPSHTPGTVAKQILIAQHDTDALGHAGQIVRIINAKSVPSGYFAHGVQQLRTQGLFQGHELTVIYADGIDHYISLFYQRRNFPLGIAAVVVTSIGDDEQGFPLILGLAHLADSQVTAS